VVFRVDTFLTPVPVATSMPRAVTDALAALAAAALLGYGLFVVGQPLFGAAAAVTTTLPYATWRRGEREHAVVLTVLWAALAAALWTARLEFVLPVVAVTALAYLGWTVRRGGSLG
jgi:hypothetical protein